MSLLSRPGLAAAIAATALAGWLAVARPAEAADLFTVSGLSEDITARDATIARQQAFARARQDGYAALIQRLASPGDAAKLPQPSEADLDNLVLSIVVEQEKRSSVRYIAQLAVRFKPDAVKQMLAGAGITIPDWPGKPVTVIPVLQSPAGPLLWEPGNGWAKAWASPVTVGLVPFVVPPPPAAQPPGLPDAVAAAAGGDEALDEFGARYGAAEILIAVAAPQAAAPSPPATAPQAAIPATPPASGAPPAVPPGQSPAAAGPSLLVTLWGRGPLSSAFAGTRSYLPNAGETMDQMLVRAAGEIAGAMDDRFRTRGAAPPGPPATLAVAVTLGGLADWVALRRKLSATPDVQSYQVAALARNGASLVLTYLGDQGQLQAALMDGGLVLSWQGDHWVLQNVVARPAAAPAPASGTTPAPTGGASP